MSSKFFPSAILTLLFCGGTAQAQIVSPNFLPFQALITDSSDQPIINTAVGSPTFNIQITDQANNCVLYRESFSPQTTDNKGMISVLIGTGTYTHAQANPLMNTFQDVFTYTAGQTFSLCADDTTPTGPFAATDGRQISFSLDGGATWSAGVSIGAVPFAYHADDANTLQGITPGNFIQVLSGTVTQNNLEALTNGSDVSLLTPPLHNHDSRYAQLNAPNTFSGNIDTTASVGIGTTNPNATLDVEGAAPTVRIGGTTNSGQPLTLAFYGSGAQPNAAITSWDDADTLAFSTNNIQAMSISSSQQVTFSSSASITGTLGLGKYNSTQEPLLISALQALPASSTQGTMWENSSTQQIRYWDGAMAQTFVPFSALGSYVTSVTATTPLAISGSPTTPNIGLPQATTSVSGFLGSSDFANFANKMSLSGDTMTGALDINGSVNAVQLAVTGAAGQSSDLTDWINNAGTIMASVDSSGTFYGNGSGLTNVTGTISGLTSGRVTLSNTATTVTDSANLTFNSATGSVGFGGSAPGITSTGAFGISSNGASVTNQAGTSVGLSVKGAASQSSDLVDVLNNTGTVLVDVASDGSLNMNGSPIHNVANPGANGDAVNEGNLNTQLNGYLALTGGTMTGALNFATWTTGTRPASPVSGTTGYNINLNELETYTSGGWISGNSSTVTNVLATSPIQTSGGTTPTISILPASGAQNGYLASSDWATFNNKQSSINLASGSVMFSNGAIGNVSQDNSNFYWDEVDHRLGLGTNEPFYTLSVTGQEKILSNNAGITPLVVVGESGQTVPYLSVSDDLGNPYFNVGLNGSSNGYVGIGTATPYDLLSNSSGPIIDQSGIGSTGTLGTSQSIAWSAAGTGYVESLYQGLPSVSGMGLLVKIANTSSGRILTLGTGPSQNTAGTDVFVVQGSGNVGIGTTNPSESLEVAHNIKVDGQFYQNTYVNFVGTTNINWNNGNIQSDSLSPNNTLQFNNMQEGGSYVLQLTNNGGTGGPYMFQGEGCEGCVFVPALVYLPVNYVAHLNFRRVQSIVYVDWNSQPYQDTSFSGTIDWNDGPSQTVSVDTGPSFNIDLNDSAGSLTPNTAYTLQLTDTYSNAISVTFNAPGGYTFQSTGNTQVTLNIPANYPANIQFQASGMVITTSWNSPSTFVGLADASGTPNISNPNWGAAYPNGNINTGPNFSGSYYGVNNANYECSVEYSGSHFCTDDEMKKYLEYYGGGAPTSPNGLPFNGTLNILYYASLDPGDICQNFTSALVTNTNTVLQCTLLSNQISQGTCTFNNGLTCSTGNAFLACCH